MCLISTWAGKCPVGWSVGPQKDKCFGYINATLAWNESEIHCQSYGGHLAALASFEELSFTENLCQETTHRCWIGGRAINSSVGHDWKWSDNSSYWNETLFLRVPLLSNCGRFSCRGNISTDLCTVVINGSKSLSGERCNATNGFICMTEIGK